MQSSTAARAGCRGLKEAGAPRGARSYAEQPEGPEARPGCGMQQLSERRGRDGGAEARGSGAQGAGHATQQGKHRRTGTCERRTTRPRHPTKPRTTGSPASAREALLRQRATSPGPDCALCWEPPMQLGEASNPVVVFSAVLPSLPNLPTFLNPHQALLLHGMCSGLTPTQAGPFIQNSPHFKIFWNRQVWGTLRLACTQLLWSGHSFWKPPYLLLIQPVFCFVLFFKWTIIFLGTGIHGLHHHLG